jgi:hypothetical protein
MPTNPVCERFNCALRGCSQELMTEAPIVAMLSAPTRYKDKTFANEIEKALEKEFPDGAGERPRGRSTPRLVETVANRTT